MGDYLIDTNILVRLVLEHGIGHILTFNVDDFARYSEITAVNPRSLSGVPT